MSARKRTLLKVIILGDSGYDYDERISFVGLWFVVGWFGVLVFCEFCLGEGVGCLWGVVFVCDFLVYGCTLCGEV
jgi:hypothetical protein